MSEAICPHKSISADNPVYASECEECQAELVATLRRQLSEARRALEEMRRPALAVLELWDSEDCGITSAIELLRKAALASTDQPQTHTEGK